MEFGILSLLPPVIAIALALITKEVYISLFVGIVSGALIYTQFNLVTAATTMFDTMTSKIYGDGWNANILIFLVILGMIVALMQKAGGSAAYGRWASERIKSRAGAQLSTSALGALIFIDDYFNCLTVGSVMRPLTDKHRVSRAKLAYIIDATAAPVCIIAPISSWAAAVASSFPEGSDIDGFSVFLRTIPFNLYAILTLLMLVLLAFWKFDFGPMKQHEDNALGSGDLFTTPDRPFGDAETEDDGKGRVFDLIIPIVALIGFCILGMLYTGGFFEGAGFTTAIQDCDASVGLVLGGLATLVLMMILYLPRKVVSFSQFSNGVIDGFRAMVPAIAILVFAWTLSGITSLLSADVYVAGLFSTGETILALLPAIMFAVALFLAFSTGTSWGTFGILIPIVCEVFGGVDSTALVVAVSAVLAGAVCGDHCSPISDTTIMASAGAQCNHINHVSTQLPYALLVAGCCFVGYIVAGFTGNIVITLVVSIGLLLAALFTAKKLAEKKSA